MTLEEFVNLEMSPAKAFLLGMIFPLYTEKTAANGNRYVLAQVRHNAAHISEEDILEHHKRIKQFLGSYKLSEKIKNGDNFIIIIERTGCGYCEMYMPIVEDVAKEYAIPIYYMDIADLSNEESVKLNESNTYLKRSKWGTPTTLLMSGEVVADTISQYVEKDKFVEFIKKNIILDKEKEEE